MKQKRQYPKVMITSKAKRSIQNGHPWIYGEEILEIEGDPKNGELVDVFAKNSFMGTGFYNSTSKITVRLISRNANDVFVLAFGIAAWNMLSVTAKPLCQVVTLPVAA